MTLTNRFQEAPEGLAGASSFGLIGIPMRLMPKPCMVGVRPQTRDSPEEDESMRVKS